jgi:hypothetical protein
MLWMDTWSSNAQLQPRPQTRIVDSLGEYPKGAIPMGQMEIRRSAQDDGVHWDPLGWVPILKGFVFLQEVEKTSIIDKR